MTTRGITTPPEGVNSIKYNGGKGPVSILDSLSVKASEVSKLTNPLETRYSVSLRRLARDSHGRCHCEAHF